MMNGNMVFNSGVWKISLKANQALVNTNFTEIPDGILFFQGRSGILHLPLVYIYNGIARCSAEPPKMSKFFTFDVNKDVTANIRFKACTSAKPNRL